MAQDERIKQLRATRADYNEEAAWHRFLLDAAYGTGGFRGKVGATAVSHLGWAAEAYAKIQLFTAHNQGVKLANGRITYLDQFAREDLEKFQRRADLAHYTNYVGPLHDLLLAHINKTEMNRDKTGDAIDEWMRDCDGRGTTWDTMQRETIRPRASLLGWCPVLVDIAGGDGAPALTRAQERELGRRPRLIPLYPINVLDWIVDEDGHLIAIKIRTDYEARDSLLSEPVTEERYSLWYADRVEHYVVRVDRDGNESIASVEERAHGYGKIPLVIWRAKATPDDRIRGMSSIGNSAVAAKRLFNLESEMDEFIRGQVFAILGIPVADTAEGGMGEITIGASNAIAIPKDAHMGLHYVAPPSSVSDALEKRMEVMVREIYRTEHIEHAKPTGTTATSGVARAYEFEQTNRRLAGIASSFARAEEKGLRLVAELLGDSSAEELTVTAPTDFSIEDLTAELEAVLAALELRLGPTAEASIKKRIIKRLMPNLPQDTQDAIDTEIDEQQLQAEQERAMQQELDRATQGNGEEGDGASDDDDEEAA